MLPAELRAKYTYPIDIPELTGAGLDKALSALIAYLGQKRVKNEPEHGPQKEWSVTTVSLLLIIIIYYRPKFQSTVLSYLQLTVFQDAPTVIDTALLKAYVKTTKGKLAQSLLRLPNHCHLKECERVLLASQVSLSIRKWLFQRANFYFEEIRRLDSTIQKQEDASRCLRIVAKVSAFRGLT